MVSANPVFKGEFTPSAFQIRFRCWGLCRNRIFTPSFLPVTACVCRPLNGPKHFGLVLLEAMRYGKPVVASDISGSGIGWVVEDGVTGFLVPPGDPVSLAKSLRILFDRPDLKLQMGLSASKRFTKVFQIDRIARETILLYHHTLNSFRKPQDG